MISRMQTAMTVLLLMLSATVTSSVQGDEPYAPKEVPGVEKITLLPPGPGNPRNSEGDFIELADGRLLFIYSHFTGGGSDHASAHLASRTSTDGGRTWSDEDSLVVDNEGGFNVMSVSLLRLHDGRIALFYLVKNSLDDCRPWMRISEDEAATWSDPTPCIDVPGYNVLNNDRAVQLDDGRLVLPVALHRNTEGRFDARGEIRCYLSDDTGETWNRSQTSQQGDGLTLQEPGVVALKDGRVMMFCRTPHGSQYLSFSDDRGETWSDFAPSDIPSPQSPATIERIPGTDDLLLIWNNHEEIDEALKGRRTPFHVAVSDDEGRTWSRVKVLEDDPNGWYCYTALAFVDDHVLLGHCAGDRRESGLGTTQITRFPIAWLYDDEAGTP